MVAKHKSPAPSHIPMIESPHVPPRHLRRLDTPVAGILWLSGMPARLGGWTEFLEDARRAQIDLALCLTPRHEIERLSPSYARAIDEQRLPFEWWHEPMRDFGLSASMGDYERTVDRTAERLKDGANVLLHCAAGIGRTGTTAACLLVRLGMPGPLALQRVRDAGSSPESSLQSGLLARFEPGHAR